MPEVAANRRTGTSGFSVKYPLVFGQRSGCFERISFIFAHCAEISPRSHASSRIPKPNTFGPGSYIFLVFLCAAGFRRQTLLDDPSHVERIMASMAELIPSVPPLEGVFKAAVGHHSAVRTSNIARAMKFYSLLGMKEVSTVGILPAWREGMQRGQRPFHVRLFRPGLL